MKRQAIAVWQGTGKEGKGFLSTQSEALKEAEYTSNSRFEEGHPGTNPEELIAAAHAGCFSMKLAYLLDDAGFQPHVLETSCTTTLGDKAITNSHLSLKAKIDKIEDAKFQDLVIKAKDTCPISQSLKMEITVDASLVS